jgi:hypothetical protein
MDRRRFLATIAAGSAAFATLLRAHDEAAATPIAQTFGPLVPDPAGILDLPPGFRYKVLIRTGDVMSDGNVFRPDPDLGLVQELGGGRRYLIVGHEVTADREFEGRFTGGLDRLLIGPGNEVIESRLLSQGTRTNCSGGLTPWGTVLSGEEFPRLPYEQFPNEGYVWEVDIETGSQRRLDALGRYSHEAALVDARTGAVYCTEDDRDCLFYKFQPTRIGDLTAGELFAYVMESKSWVKIDDVYRAREEGQAKGATKFNRHEGMVWGKDGKLYICETGNPALAIPDLVGRIRRFDPATDTMETFIEGGLTTSVMPDNLTVDPNGNLYVCEDRSLPMVQLVGPNAIRVIAPNGLVSRFATMHNGWEPSGPAFSADGKTMYLNVLEPNGMTLAIEGF